MTQEDKQLLFNDLCVKLPYDVIVNIEYSKEHGSSYRLRVCNEGDLKLNVDLLGLFMQEEIYLKPYLRPMSSMTEEERYEFQEILGDDIEFYDDILSIIDSSRKRFSLLELQTIFNWIDSRHFDYRGLIEKGLALQALEGMYN